LLSVLADARHPAKGKVSGGGPPPHFNKPGDNLPTPVTVSNYHNLLQRMFADPVKWRNIPRDPANDAEPPSRRSPERPGWDRGQLQTS
jgi:hypothetical protein